ncbi:MAG: UDP-N-acetylmuramoyl-L-alanyl-D-glutamate--2,6-diaminopimelate ligase [Candidatus Omnitrophica bacterium]|nr:UDP-N-acetylmuramoyl-L-alanyl-D-glutamate--2,6-diaminopimelate ligase [Candidatus Omnitrophota bacterium]
MNRPAVALGELLSGVGIEAGVHAGLTVTQVTDDSRQVREGALFVAVGGTKTDGHRFIEQAAAKGARAVLVDREAQAPGGMVVIRVPATQPLLGPVASSFYGNPSDKMAVVGVTGTNGKTTVSWLTRYLLEAAGVHCGLIGTIHYQIGPVMKESVNTTPGAVTIQSMLYEMLQAGLKACVMEVSSHALHQRRTDGISWKAGVFTNITSEHLDYHETWEDYFKAKLRLFEALEPQAAAVINGDDPVWERIRWVTRGRVIRYSLRQEADLAASKIVCRLDGTTCEVQTPEGSFPVRWKLVGRHNIQNLLASLGAVMGTGTPLSKVIPAVESFSGVPGRLERVDEGGPFPVFVDYAHTDDALFQVLANVKAVTPKKVLLVFGCGGDRDRTKRPRMGKVASELADRVIVTSDNPRSEDPARIAKEIEQGLWGSSTPWETILDRREAIRKAIESADAGWLVLIAGKGHETGQKIGDKVIPFDDRHVARDILKKSKLSGVGSNA